MKKSFSTSPSVVIILILVTLLTGCGGNGGETPSPTVIPQPPEVELFLNPDISDVLAGQMVSLAANATGKNLTFKWSVIRGSLSAFDTPAVIYTAPDTPGADTVTVEVSSTSGITTKSVSFNVTVPITETSIATIIPINTPLPPPLPEIFPQAIDGQKFAFVSEGEELTSEFVGDQNCIHSGAYGIRFIYDMKEPLSGGWGVHWNNPPIKTYFDASEFQTLTFWVRGMLGNERFQVAMKDTDDNEFWMESIDLLVVTQEWQMATAQLNAFEGVSVDSLENISFGFNHTHGPGEICIDDIAFAP